MTQPNFKIIGQSVDEVFPFTTDIDTQLEQCQYMTRISYRYEDKEALADIPTILKKNQCENYYETVTHVIFRQTGFTVISEFQSIAGRSDTS